MRKLFFPLLLSTLFPFSVSANPACPVCTIAIGASLGVARSLGVADTIVGLWAGALLCLLGYWTILFFDKRKWFFFGRDILIMSLSVSMIGFMFIKDLAYTPEPLLYFFILILFFFLHFLALSFLPPVKNFMFF